VKTCGNQESGGNSKSVQSKLKNVKMIYATECAFVALLKDETIVAWGKEEFGGVLPATIVGKKVQLITSTDTAFSAILNDGRVITWGDLTAAREISKDFGVKIIIPLHHNFLGLLKDGTIIRWGKEYFITEKIQNIRKVKKIFSTTAPFTTCAVLAILENERIVAWGDPNYGGVIPIQSINNVKTVKMVAVTDGAFAVLFNDGTVVAWGSLEGGGDTEEIQEKLNKNVKMILSTTNAFAALLKDGSVVVWGIRSCGGKLNVMMDQHLRENVKMIFATETAFAALLDDGSVFAWGNKLCGGEIPDDVKAELKNKKALTIIPSAKSFTAICAEGEFQWGTIQTPPYLF
jgi:alpha-tubulin suppressor-like RCC1 family protein